MVHAFGDAGEQVVVLDNLTTGFDWAVPPSAKLAIGDAGDQSCVAALIAQHRVDAVLHFAASIVVPDSVRDPLGYYRNNTMNSRALIETAVKQGVRNFISHRQRPSTAIPRACRCARTIPPYRHRPMVPRN
jgi:UDP-glucose 4-epimerase